MANLEDQKYDIYVMPELDVTIARYYVQDSPDSVGTLDDIIKMVWEHYRKMPFKSLWKGARIEFWDMASPDLISSRNVTLKDYDLHKEGDQGASGLYFSADSKRIALAVYNNAFSVQGVSPPEFARQTFSHEWGHLYGDLVGLLENKNAIETLLTQNFHLYKPKQAQSDSEDIAEVYRALLGGPDTIGTYSDKKKADLPPEMYTLMRTAYWLSRNLASKTVEDLTFYSRWCVYKLRTVYPWYAMKPDSLTFHALTANWDSFDWVGGKWKSK